MTRNNKASLTAILSLTAVGALILTGCSSNGDSGDNADAGPLINEGVFKICSETAYPPFEFKDDSTGEIVGFDIDFAKEIAKDLDAKLEIVSSSFESIESGAALDAKNCDAVISGISINDERATKFDFSEPYFDDNLALLVREDSGITSLDSFDGVVGVQDATTGQAFATEKGLDPKAFEDGTIAVQALQSGGVDGVINNIATLAYFAKDDSSLVIADKFGSEPLGAGVRKGNTELLDSINATLKRMDEDGTREAMLAQWMPAIK